MMFVILIFYMQCAKALIGTDFGKIYNQMVSFKHALFLVAIKIRSSGTVICHKHGTVFPSLSPLQKWPLKSQYGDRTTVDHSSGYGQFHILHSIYRPRYITWMNLKRLNIISSILKMCERLSENALQLLKVHSYNMVHARYSVLYRLHIKQTISDDVVIGQWPSYDFQDRCWFSMLIGSLV